MTENDKIITTMRVFELIKNISDPCEMLPIIATSLDFWCKLYGEDIITITENLAEAAQIDNAPTVEPEITNDDLRAAMTESYRLGYELAETKFKRPQGEWKPDMDSFYCDQCGVTALEINRKWYKSNFCPNCGASMVDIKGEIEGDYEIIGKYDERPQGKWIIVDDTEKFIAKCSVCGRIEDSRMVKDYPFCHCGADMRKGGTV